GNHNNSDYDSEPERTLFRRRRETRRARQAALEQQFNMAANNMTFQSMKKLINESHLDNTVNLLLKDVAAPF
ncbi:hypothetical protein PIB30_099701, partial [Stylosanthes scabra]|nr:hypothetical protein [Stylosanthes scabra]